MATIKPPPNQGKGAPPSGKPTPNDPHHPEPVEWVTMNFSVPAEFRKAYKRFALDHDLSMVDLLKKSFTLFKASMIP